MAIFLPFGYVEASLPRAEPEHLVDPVSAEITLALPEDLLETAEAAAAAEGISTTTWLARALARAVAPSWEARWS